MPSTERVTVTLPADIVEGIARHEPNRSRFVLEAVRAELERREHEAFLESLRNPAPEALELANLGAAQWMASAAEGDDGLVDMASGTPVRWVPGEGWIAVNDE